MKVERELFQLQFDWLQSSKGQPCYELQGCSASNPQRLLKVPGGSPTTTTRGCKGTEGSRIALCEPFPLVCVVLCFEGSLGLGFCVGVAHGGGYPMAHYASKTASTSKISMDDETWVNAHQRPAYEWYLQDDDGKILRRPSKSGKRQLTLHCLWRQFVEGVGRLPNH